MVKRTFKQPRSFFSRTLYIAACACLSVCMYVLLSDTFLYCVETSRPRPNHNVFHHRVADRNPPPLTQVKYEKSRFSTNITLYLGNDISWTYSHIGLQLGNRRPETVPKLSNGIANDLEWPLTQILRSRHFKRQITRQRHNTLQIWYASKY